MSFVLYGQFANANDRLACFEISDGSTDLNRGRTSKRKCEINEKADERSHDNSKPRGHARDQMLASEALRLKRLTYEQTKNESNIMDRVQHES